MHAHKTFRMAVKDSFRLGKLAHLCEHKSTLICSVSMKPHLMLANHALNIMLSVWLECSTPSNQTEEPAEGATSQNVDVADVGLQLSRQTSVHLCVFTLLTLP